METNFANLLRKCEICDYSHGWNNFKFMKKKLSEKSEVFIYAAKIFKFSMKKNMTQKCFLVRVLVELIGNLTAGNDVSGITVLSSTQKMYYLIEVQGKAPLAYTNICVKTKVLIGVFMYMNLFLSLMILHTINSTNQLLWFHCQISFHIFRHVS